MSISTSFSVKNCFFVLSVYIFIVVNVSTTNILSALKQNETSKESNTLNEGVLNPEDVLHPDFNNLSETERKNILPNSHANANTSYFPNELERRTKRYGQGQKRSKNMRQRKKERKQNKDFYSNRNR